MNRLLALFLVALLTACSGGDSTEKPKSPSASATTTVTNAQYASVVAESASDIHSTIQDFEDQTCFFPTVDVSPACSAQAITLSYQAEALRGRLADARDELGEPPAEIGSLVAETILDADGYIDAHDALTASCGTLGQREGDGCDRKRIAVTTAANRLKARLDAWSPYL
jgi:hypothetical protein